MPTAQTNVVQGSFTSDGNARNIDLGFLPTRFQTINQTQANSTANPGVVKKSEWNSSLSAGSAYVVKNTAGAATDESSLITSNGFTQVDGRQSVLLGAAVTGTTITKANPAVCTATGHGFVTGDLVQITNNAVMKQLGGLFFTITVIDANTFSIPINTNTANFTAETSFTARKVIIGPLYSPQRRTIVGITAANPIVISTSAAHGLTVGQQVRLRIPKVFGMIQADKLQGVITAVTSTTLTIGGIDSSAFTAFAWPASSSVPLNFAQIVPIGSGPIGNPAQDLLDDATDNSGIQGINLGSSVCGANNDVIQWIAFRSDSNS